MFTYTLRKSPRSRHVRLSVSQHSGLVIVVPLGFDISKISGILAEKERWIKRAMDKVQLHAALAKFPTQINIQSIGSLYNIEIELHSNRRNYLLEENNTIKLCINPRSGKIAFTLIKKWLKLKSRTILLPWLERGSKEHGFTYNRATIRGQRTRWGSCSKKKNINLNRAMIFLPPEQVEYLIIHELCHTVELNHSKKYWELVEKYCQNHRALDKELKNAGRYIEGWMI
jgi:predicted metal-dependent hydrolase